MPIIKRVTPHPFHIPLKGALRWGKSSELAALDHVLVEVELSDGSLGRAEIPPRPTIYGETVGTVLAVVDYLASRLVGLDIEDAWAHRKVFDAFPANLTAKGGLDIALWEARAKSQGKELYQLLPPGHQRVRVSYILGIADTEEMLADAAYVYAMGVRVLKVKVGPGLEGDLEKIAMIKNRFPEIDLYADANETLGADNAEKYLTAWRDAGLMYVEEPLPVEQVSARKKLRQAGILPLIADDSAFTIRDLQRELELDTFDVLNIKPARSGVSWSLEMISLAGAAGKKVMLGSQALSSFGAYQTALLSFQGPVTEPCELSFHLKAEGGFHGFPELKAGFLYWEDLVKCRFDRANFERFVL